MQTPSAKRRLAIYALLLGGGLGVCAWQAQEHSRFERNAREALINRGRDITSTLGVLVRSQRRFGVVSKERLESALQELVRPQELNSIAILSATGETVASAGDRVELTPGMMASGVFWGEHSLTIMNLMDLGVEDGGRTIRPPVVVSDRTPPPRRPGARDRDDDDDGRRRFPFPAPPWMSREEYDEVIQKRGMHNLIIALSTDSMRRAVNADLLVRSLASLLAMGGAIISTLALRNFARSSELQLRLVKAGEMNTHLKEMNLAAAGLAHETRNPLNIIRGLAQMIAMRSTDTQSLKGHATTIIEETDRVTVQLNEFINYSKPREPQLSSVVVSRLVSDVARTIMPDLEEKNVTFVQADPESTQAIQADEQLLRQALFNILLNAAQAVEVGGRIEMRLRVAAGKAEIEICDDGPGVPPDDRASIFRPYVTMRKGGVGLGLAIVHQIISAHHWTITCEANQPKGACFRIAGIHLATPVT